MPTSHSPAARSGRRGARNRQQRDEPGEHDEGGDRVEGCEKRGHDDERRGQLGHRVGARPAGLPGSGMSGTRSRISRVRPAGTSDRRARVRTRGRASRRRCHVPSHATRRAGGRSSPQVRRSWPKVGSSSTRSDGAVASAVATDSRRFSPPERVNGFAAARRVRPQPLEQLVGTAAGDRVAEPGSPRPEQELVPDGTGEELVLGVLEDGADSPDQVACRPAGNRLVPVARRRAPHPATTRPMRGRAVRRASARASTCRSRSDR